MPEAKTIKRIFVIHLFMPQAMTVLNVILVGTLCLLLWFGLPIIGVHVPFLTSPANNSTSPNDSSTPNHGGFFTPITVSPPSTQIATYRDYNCSTPMFSLNWTTLTPDSSKNVSCYIKNEGTAPVTLNVLTSNWVLQDKNGTVLPSSYQQYFTFGWNGNKTVLQPNQIFNATFTLTVSLYIPRDVSTFSFDINVNVL